MKLTFAVVANSAAQMQSPSFSRSASSVTRTISPRFSAARQSSTVSTLSFMMNVFSESNYYAGKEPSRTSAT